MKTILPKAITFLFQRFDGYGTRWVVHCITQCLSKIADFPIKFCLVGVPRCYCRYVSFHILVSWPFLFQAVGFGAIVVTAPVVLVGLVILRLADVNRV